MLKGILKTSFSVGFHSTPVLEFGTEVYPVYLSESLAIFQA